MKVISAVRNCLHYLNNGGKNGTVYMPVELPDGNRLEMWATFQHHSKSHQSHRLMVVRGVDLNYVTDRLLPLIRTNGRDVRVVEGWDRSRLLFEFGFNFDLLGPNQPLADPTCVLVLQ